MIKKQTMKKDTMDWIAIVLTLIGGINWGLVGFFNWNLVAAILPETAARVVYAIVGLAALYLIYTASKN